MGYAGFLKCVTVKNIYMNVYTCIIIKRRANLVKHTDIIIILMLLISAFFYIIMPKASYYESIHIKSDSDMIIYLSVLLNERGNTLEMYENPSITGKATTAIIDTEHGKALKITGSGVIEIKTGQKFFTERTGQEINRMLLDGVTITMSNLNRSSFLNKNAANGFYNESIKAWVYSENDNASFNFLVSLTNAWDSTAGYCD